MITWCDQKQPVGEINLKLTRCSRCATHFRPWPFLQCSVSLRSKRFQSSNCAKVGATAKKKKMEICSSPNFLDELVRKRLLCRLSSSRFVFMEYSSFSFSNSFHLYWFVRLNRCLIPNRLTFCLADPPQRPRKFFKAYCNYVTRPSPLYLFTPNVISNFRIEYLNCFLTSVATDNKDGYRMDMDKNF